MASGSQVWSGICADLATAPRSRASATRLLVVVPTPHVAPACENTVWKSVVPMSRAMKNTAMAMPTSPIAFMMNAFLAASTGSFRSCQYPISRYDESPTRPQPASRSTKFDAITSSSIENTNRSR